MRNYSIRKDTPDSRDLLYGAFATATTLPKSVDLSKQMSAVEDQGQLGSCTANALAGNLEYLYLKKKDQFQASRLFIYYNERLAIHETNVDSGANLRDGIKMLSTYGVCSEVTWPYNISSFKQKPNAQAYQEGLSRKITQYLRVQGLDEMKKCLAEGYPFVFGISVFESFESDKVAKTGTVPAPKKGEQNLGGHAMLCVGYNDSTKRFIVRNSWGSSWGKNGYCTLPYSYMETADDLWTIRA